MELVQPSMPLIFGVLIFYSFILLLLNKMLTHFIWDPLFNSKTKKNKKPHLHQIMLEGINVYAYHGCLEEEGKIGANYVVNITMYTDFTVAAQKDDLSKTIDYVTVYDITKQEMAIRSKLIEQPAQRIVDRLKLEFSTLQRVQVKVTKINPPMNGDVDQVSVVITE